MLLAACPQPVPTPERQRSAGFTLLEALVAVLILAVGLLGLAGLYVAGMQNTRSANLRTLATLQAYDMADRMRANIGALTIALPALPYYHLPTAVRHTSCYTGTCSSLALAQNDYWEWNDAASAVSNPRILPGGQGVVCLDSTPNDGTWDGTNLAHGCDGLGTMYAIKVWWLDERRSGVAADNAAAYQRFVTTLQPQP